MPSGVVIRDGAVWVGGRRAPLLAGEVHYWRLSPHRWRRVLEGVQRLGLSMVSTYVPWEYHELSPGRFDFGGESEPQRDLRGFLGLVKEMGLDLFIRPGPFIYAEWTNAGVPDRVVTMPRLSAEYRAEARVWMGAVTAELLPWCAGAESGGAGGPIVLWQVDNEFDLFSHWFEGRCGLDSGEGFFQEFLRGAYGTVEALNAAWGVSLARFEEARAFAEAPDPHDPRQRARARDYWRFQHWAVREGIRWHAEEYRRLGVTLPLVANYYPGGDVQNWRELSRVVDVVGIDWYPRNEFGAGVGASQGASMTGAAAAGAEEEHRRFLDTCRYQRAVSPLPCIAEAECGVWHGYHGYVGVLSPNHYRLMLVSALMAGIRGINWYMIAGRDNWYYTPVNERGELRPELAEEFMALHRVWREVDPPSLEKVTDACVLIHPEQIGTDGIFAENAVLRAMHASGAEFEIVDPECLDDSHPRHGLVKRVMVYGAADWLAREDGARLARWVEAGGTLVLFRSRPARDERFGAFDPLGLSPPDRVLSRLGKRVRVEIGEGGVAEGALWVWERPPAGAEPVWCEQVAGAQQAVENADKWMLNYRGKRWVCGYVQARGRGRIVNLGLAAGAEVALAALGAFGAAPACRSLSAGVRAALYRRAGGAEAGRVVFATNMNDCDVTARVAVERPGPARELFSGRECDAAAAEISVEVPRRGGAVVVMD